MSQRLVDVALARDKFVATINRPTIQEKVADGSVLFSRMVEKCRAAHVEAEAAGRFLLAKPTRDKYIIHLEQRIVPQWGDRRLCEIKPDEVQQWLFTTCEFTRSTKPSSKKPNTWEIDPFAGNALPHRGRGHPESTWSPPRSSSLRTSRNVAYVDPSRFDSASVLKRVFPPPSPLVSPRFL